MQPKDVLGDFINEKLAEQDRRDMYGLATAPNASRVRFGDGGSGVTPAQQRALEAGLGPRSAENAQAISDYASWLVANTDLSMSLQPKNAGAGRGFVNPPLAGASSASSTSAPRDTEFVSGLFDEGAGSGPVYQEPGSYFGSSKAAKFGRAIANDPIGEVLSAAGGAWNWAVSQVEGLLRSSAFSGAVSPEMSMAAALNPRIAADQQSILGSIDSIKLPRVSYMSNDGLGPFTEGAIDGGLVGSGAFSLFRATGSFSSLSRLPGQTYIAGEGLVLDRAATAARQLDLSGQFTVSKSGSGVRVQYGNPDYWEVADSSHGIVGFVDKNGVLGFNVFANRELRATYGSGSDMFNGMLKRLGQEGVEVRGIRGAWESGTDSVNYAQYRAGLANGLTAEQAALNTWTGRQVQQQGFTFVESIVDQKNVYVTFRKPK